MWFIDIPQGLSMLLDSISKNRTFMFYQVPAIEIPREISDDNGHFNQSSKS